MSKLGDYPEKHFPSNYTPTPGPLTKQVGGNHYKKLKLQPWQIIDALGLDYYQGTILKYLVRDKGNKVEDLKKALHTLEHYIEVEENKIITRQCSSTWPAWGGTVIDPT